VTFSDSATSTPVGTVRVTACPPGLPASAVCASLNTTPGQLATGAHIITATYNADNADTNYQTSKSAVAITVLAAISTTPGQVIPAQTVHIDNPGAPTQT